jgi:mannosyltransferase OCH1-like enzyme
MDAVPSASVQMRWPAWVWVDYADSAPPRHILLNLKALQHHAPPHFSVHVLNRSNIKQFLPDLPPAFWLLPNQVAFSDVARAALLMEHGGLWLDADFLVQRSLEPVASALGEHTLVAYEVKGQDCARGKMSQNFIAARRNSSY